MKFDKSKVYTTFTVDEVKIGSKGYFADTKEELIHKVQSEDERYYDSLDNINTDVNEYVFYTSGRTYRCFKNE